MLKQTRKSFLVATTGETRGLLAQVFARDEREAERVMAATFEEYLGEEGKATCIDEQAVPGIWFEGDPKYIRRVIAAGAR